MDFDEELNREVGRRLSAMEDSRYDFPERMRKSDWIAAIAIALTALVLTEVATLTAGWM